MRSVRFRLYARARAWCGCVVSLSVVCEICMHFTVCNFHVSSLLNEEEIEDLLERHLLRK